MSDELDTWQKQEHETDRAYAFFCVYRDLGPRRSLGRACQIFYELGEDPIPTTSPKLRQAKEWSAKHGWVSRAAAYDQRIEHEARIDHLDAVKEMRRRHATVANMALAKATEKLRAVASESLSVADAARLLDLAVKVERLARGEASDRVEHSGLHGEPIQIETSIRDEITEKFRQMSERALLALQAEETAEHDDDANSA